MKVVTPLSRLTGFLIAVYLAQIVTSFSVGLLASVIAATYICVPLAFVFLLPRTYPQFDLRSLALYTTILMIPIHAIGLVQQFVNPSFMISTAYSEGGGIIARNFLDAGSFFRLPSIFASADRYSGVAMMQIFLTFVLLSGSKPPTRRMAIWVVISLFAGFASLFIAGARSRIIIVSITLTVAGLVLIFGAIRRKVSRLAMRRTLTLAVLFAVGLTASLSIQSVRDRVADFPIFVMLQQTIVQNDVSRRFDQSLRVSEVPEGVTLFGEGLGFDSGGRPGEFGIRAMWIESGLFWTPIMLAIHAMILFWLVKSTLYLLLSDPLLTILGVGSILAWLFALLAGFSSTFELSQALLLFPTIAVFSIATYSRRLKPAPLSDVAQSSKRIS